MNLVLRIQSSEGTKRVNVSPDDNVSGLYEKVREVFSLSSFAFSLCRSRNLRDELPSTRSKTISSSGLKHGDILYLLPIDGAELWPSSDNEGASSLATPGTSKSSTSQSTTGDIRDGLGYNSSYPVKSSNSSTIVEDEVDLILTAMDGKILRKKDEKYCRHGANACCVHCSPMEPYDEAYLREQNIKHMSFHSYLRKLKGGADRGKFIVLEDTQCRIKSGCKDHPPWPRGICSKCQPSAITLNRQIYRNVDNVMFENPQIVERFLDYWRSSGHQRIGFLYGKYEVHADVPLGIRATVAAIYEPPQETSRDKVRLLPDEREEIVNDIAHQLGLKKVGWIFTDLIAEDVQKGTVRHIRSIDSHFLSAQECITAGHFQNLHPNPCKFSGNGYFGSKFTTVCVTGDSTNQVHMEGYCVSNQCMSLVRDSCIVPTKDSPSLGYIKESSDKQYVPDVYYKEKDNYGNEISKLARPLPVEYLLVDVPVSTPLTPLYTFRSDPSKQHFPVENRYLDKHIQDFETFSKYMQQFSPDQFLLAMSDFHVLLYIATMEMLPMKDYLGPLIKAIRERDEAAAGEWSRSEQWATITELIAASDGTIQEVTGQEWTCNHCTFLNPSRLTSCEICSLPR